MSQPPRPVRIFLAEDNPGDVALIREALRESRVDHILVHAPDGEEARQYVETLTDRPEAELPDLLLLDLNLPKCDGDELLAMFRAHPYCRDTAAIIVTSSNAQRDRERAAQLGASRYFRKPSDLTEYLRLGQIVREVILENGLRSS